MSSSRSASVNPGGFRAGVGLENVARRTLGIFLLSVTVFLWTASNFLASYIFADNTFSKPYFVTYLNTSCFAVSLFPIFLRAPYRRNLSEIRAAILEYFQSSKKSNRWGRRKSTDSTEDPLSTSETRLLGDGESPGERLSGTYPLADSDGPLGFRDTVAISLEFSLLWFTANYLVAACLEYTSVASSTILTSMSSIFTLLFGALMGVEHFSFRKLVGVLACFAGIILISTVDLSDEDNDENRGKFPHKSQSQIAIGDAMAFGSAVMYGMYTVVMKKRIGNEDRVNMPLFFGLVGLFNVIFLWPGFLVLHFTGVETFELPSSRKVWTVILLNSAASFISDYCWAYAMLLTTPLVVTVGISMTIPLSLLGQIVLNSQYTGAWYWLGAFIVLLSFLFINHETLEEGEPPKTT
ncbi:hypothetical protein OIDMADRAFT_39431 [Oidiodendron maius Zn]|uniref:Uncharacterized protein n=1 Tax=Oidiodendron maius (strain Zn) TaxID=913774 RepID=A0A0C3HPQ1_OIDMZ|nr:hypothetical protein OIDMADRAFT_39431 [Oidiodendron maius Zn]